MTAPMIVAWNLTRLCNLACGHCYLNAVQRRRESPDELNTLEALSVVKQIADLAPGAMLVLSGGEPLLRRDLPVLVKAAAKRGLMPVIGTNGTLLNPRRAAELKDAGAAGVGVSLDSAEPAFHDRLRGLAGAWEGAMRGIRAARGAGLAVLLQATMFAENRRELVLLADIAESLGAIAFNVFFLVCTGRGARWTDLPPAAYEETLADIVRLQRERPELVMRARCAPYMRRLLALHGGEGAGGYAGWSSACLAGRSYFRITPHGQVTPCPYLPEAVGDLRKTALREIWEQPPVFARLRTELPGGKCGDCDFRYGCGGCRARAFAQHGDVMAEDPKCTYTRPPGSRPEARPAPVTAPAVSWDPAAQALLERIPGFVRARVRARLEDCAGKEGVPRITVEFMRAHRPAGPFRSLVSGPGAERAPGGG
ncbi:MAG: radical SAM protein [Betaproteobacteria bacterium]|nr:radical SAM protein [Betaproteobacteria bacterium]